MDCTHQWSNFLLRFMQELHLLPKYILFPQCSEPCGYGIQSRTVSCMGPSTPEPLSPLLCMHMPKPITIQGCNVARCMSQPARVTVASPTQAPTLRHTAAPPTSGQSQRIEDAVTFLGSGSGLEASRRRWCVHSPGACGRLLLEPSGTVDLRNATGRCLVSIGRPLDEVIVVEVTSASLSCRKSVFSSAWIILFCAPRYSSGGRTDSLSLSLFTAEEYVAFFDRLALVRKCEQVTGSELTTRTNVLLVRQNLLSPGNGTVFTYRSHKNTKKNHQGEAASWTPLVRQVKVANVFAASVQHNLTSTIFIHINISEAKRL